MKRYTIQNPNSSAPAEEVSQEQLDAMKGSGRLRGYTVAELPTSAKPAELTAEKTAKTARSDDK